MTGGRGLRDLFHDLFSEITAALAGVTPPAMPEPTGIEVDPARYVGTYAREGMSYEIAEQDGALVVTITPTSALTAAPPVMAPLLPHSEDVLLVQMPGADITPPAVFFELDGDFYVHTGARTTRRQR